jgi:hypothetical protein
MALPRGSASNSRRPTASCIRLRRLPIGRAWEALRKDEVVCRALAAKVPGICPKIADDFAAKSADNGSGFTRRAGCFL